MTPDEWRKRSQEIFRLAWRSKSAADDGPLKKLLDETERELDKVFRGILNH